MTIESTKSDHIDRPDAHLDMHDCVKYADCLDVAANKNLPRVCAKRTKTCYVPRTLDEKIWLAGASHCRCNWPDMPDERRTVNKGDNEFAGQENWPLLIVEEIEPKGFNRQFSVVCMVCGAKGKRTKGVILGWGKGVARPKCGTCGASGWDKGE